jgi:glutamate N-acetyltransferase/amino-acid N-acetyltransferase
VNLPEIGDVAPVAGVRLATAAAQIKDPGRDDVALLVFPPGVTMAGVFTQSSFRAPPVDIAERRIRAGGVTALLINSGNANAATGEAGAADARQLCEVLAQTIGIRAECVAPFSTGVIGERLPVQRMTTAVREGVSGLRADGWLAAARAIMTTDTRPKLVSRVVEIAGRQVNVTGMAKGSGMIKPDMATMLAFVCCDAAVSPSCLDEMCRNVADVSFNRISIDADTSTNDAFVLAATGAAGTPLLDDIADRDCAILHQAVAEVATTLAQHIVRDAEGASKFVTVRVVGGATHDECLDVAYTVAESMLVKTAIFAGDPNWGRLCMAIGRAGVEALDTAGVKIFLDDVCVVSAGVVHPGYREEDGARVMAADEFEIRIELGRGEEAAVVWTSDLSYDYVRINAEYRT